MKAIIKKLRKDAIIPTKGSKKAAGYDLYACIEDSVGIRPGETAFIGTGLSITPPEGYFGAIFARSGLACKHGLRPANAVGVCDEDYTGEYIVALHNDSQEPYIVTTGERIAQLVFMPYLNIEFEETKQLAETERGSGGFGHTGR